MDRDTYEVELDGELLDVLASDTRRGILQSLQERRRTLSELSRDLDRNKSTIHEHLERLDEAGLVARDENEERKWTYYELSDEGQRIVEPQGTPVRLIIGVALAGLVAGLAVAAALGGLAGMAPTTGPIEEGQTGGAAGSSAEAVEVRLAQDQALSTSGATIQGTLAGDVDGPVRAYLVPDDGAGGDAPTQGIAVDATVEGRNLTVVLPGDVRPGDYRLYLVADGERVDVDDLPRIRLQESLADVEPSPYWKGFSGPVAVERTADVVPADATLVARPVDGSGPAAAVDLAGGEAEIPVETLDALPPGSYRLRAVADDGPSIPLGATLEVRSPDIVVTPKILREDRSTAVRAHVEPAHLADENVTVTAGGVEQAVAVDEPGTLLVRLEPADDGRLPVTVGRLAQERLGVLPAVDASIAVLENGTWEIRVRDEAGDPEAGVDVRVDGAYRASTNGSGKARIPVPDPGRHGISLDPPDARPVEAPIQVDGWDPIVLDPAVGLKANTSTTGPGEVEVSVEAENPDNATVEGTLVAQVEDDVAAASEVAIPPNGSARDVLPVENASAGNLTVTVEAQAPRSPDMTVENATAGGTAESSDGPESAGDDGGTSQDATGGWSQDPTVTAGSTRTSALVESLAEADTSTSVLEPQPLEGLSDGGGHRGAADGVDVPGPGVVLQAGALAAVALALGLRRRRR